MQHAVAGLLFLLAATGGALAAEPFTGDAVYGTEDGCEWLRTRTYPNTDGVMVITSAFLRGHESLCHFVDIKPGVHEDLFVSAICYGEGEMWPAAYAMALDPDSNALIVSTGDGSLPGPLRACPGATGALANEILGE
jgi:hypothetical protein